MDIDYSSGEILSDHDVTLAILGDVESVRTRLSDALQQLGYRVLGEQPIHAKRKTKGCAAYGCSFNILDYPTTLTISLKKTNNVAVLATFNYEIKSYAIITKGDRQTLGREAEALAALAAERLAVSACRACGTQVTDESHFCRRCGAPLVLDVPELEVLRLTSSTRSSYYNNLCRNDGDAFRAPAGFAFLRYPRSEDPLAAPLDRFFARRQRTVSGPSRALET